MVIPIFRAPGESETPNLEVSIQDLHFLNSTITNVVITWRRYMRLISSITQIWVLEPRCNMNKHFSQS